MKQRGEKTKVMITKIKTKIKEITQNHKPAKREGESRGREERKSEITTNIDDDDDDDDGLSKFAPRPAGYRVPNL